MPPLSPSVTVTTGARLHFGLLVRGEPDRRTYGGLGVMIDQPRFVLTVRSSESDQFTASAEATNRLRRLLAQWRSQEPLPPCEIAIYEEIPSHAGLGSGTQAALALAAAFRRLLGIREFDILELAQRTGRGHRSAIGTVGFAHGGLILDEGRPDCHAPEALAAWSEFPPEWRFVLITPPAHQGLFGESERKAFQQLPAMSDGLLDCLTRTMHGLPADIARRDFPACSASLWEFGQRVGEYFAPMQGGIFAHPRMAELALRLRSLGITGVGQSSWGPTLFVLCDGPEMAETVVANVNLRGDQSCQWRIAAPLNRGATVEFG